MSGDKLMRRECDWYSTSLTALYTKLGGFDTQ